MEATEYTRLAAYENWYWWYLAQREILVDEVVCLGLPPAARVLDVGCGSGRNVSELAARLGIEAYGVDCSVHAARLWNDGYRLYRCLGSANALPYVDGCFDAAICVDVICCRGVDAQESLTEMARVIRPGGWIVLMVPAYAWLLSRHDTAVHCVRRFTRRDIKSLAVGSGLSLDRLTHLFPAFFPAIAARRLVRKLTTGNGAVPARSDLSDIPAWVNRTLLAIARTEHRMIKRITVPFGSTILAVARKEKR